MAQAWNHMMLGEGTDQSSKKNKNRTTALNFFLCRGLAGGHQYIRSKKEGYCKKSSKQRRTISQKKFEYFENVFDKIHLNICEII